ncbi:hypothetical protein RUM44_013763 [Polyplax serrata]|uniref:Ectonucleoside triphosphate diphosphohydrolase 5 n=1 Tax=Polyplax serrata TaxID=468196 RepID=A0ABR1BH95_POLSC
MPVDINRKHAGYLWFQVPKEETTELKRKLKNTQSSTNKSTRTRFYIVTALVLVFCLGAYIKLFEWSTSSKATLLDRLSLTLGFKNYVHSIVIDAGSTGTRILSYGFVSSRDGNSVKLHNEYFREVKPGISSYASHPRESINSLDELLKGAKQIIPPSEWPKTSLVMKATAGLRLLPGKQAEALLREAREFFKESGFRVEDDAVSILDGSDEDRFREEVINTVVALDLGGGSTQVSFVPLKNDTLNSEQAKYLTRIVAFFKNFDVFCRSYLGLGLNEGRKLIFNHQSNNSTTVKSDCINPLVKTKWKYNGVEYSLQGSEVPHYQRTKVKGESFETPIAYFEGCERVVKDVVSKFEKPPSLAGKEIYAFSYYYERAADSGLIDFKKGGAVTVDEIVSMAKAKCQEANVDQPFMCLDLVYISVLLRDLFSLPSTHKINLVKFLDGHEVTWALGAAFLKL